MSNLKWPFGGKQASQARDAAKAAPIPVSSAEAKKFGFENFGNTCYANSVIQALYFCTPFRELLVQAPDNSLPPPPIISPPEPPTPIPISTPLVPLRRKPERKASSSGAPPDSIPSTTTNLPSPIPSSPHSLFSALRSLFLHISTHPAEKGTVGPKAFIDKLKEVNELFRGTQHQDAHEFLNYLLNKIIEEIEEDRKIIQNGTPPPEDLSSSVATLKTSVTTVSNSGTVPEEATLVHKLFEGLLTSETRCLTCETVSSRDESFLDLSIDIEQNSSVTACLRQFSASEMLFHKNKFFCDSCCDLQEAEKRMKIKKLPNVLALHLKRFKYQEETQKYVKLAYRVAFPFQLRLFNTVDNLSNADRLYSLFAIVIHIGNGPHHGHYISIIKTQGSWLVFDDENVNPIAESEIPKYFGDPNSNAGSAYVLYYEAADMDLVGLGIRSEQMTESSVDPSVIASSSQTWHSSPPIQNAPTVPPGLVDEGDSDLSDPSHPITPSHSSPLLIADNKSPLSNHLRELSISEDPSISAPPLSISASLPQPQVPPLSASRSIFSLRRSPSTKLTNSESRRSLEDELPPVPALPTASTSTAPPLAQSPASEKKEKSTLRESKSWFGKRKSLRVGDKKSASESNAPDVPPSPVVSLTIGHSDSTYLHAQAASSSSTQSNSASWFKTTANVPAKKRRPSEPPMFDANSSSIDNSASGKSKVRPKSTVVHPPAPDDVRLRVNGHESSSPLTGGSTSSSFGSANPAQSTFVPFSDESMASNGVLASPPSRKSSLPTTDFIPKAENKKSVSSITRPSTAPGEIRPLPVPPVPVPALPPLVTSQPSQPPPQEDPVGHYTDHQLSNGDLPPPVPEKYDYAFPQSVPNNVSTSTTSSSAGSPIVKRATRKISMTMPFGKKDKKDKDKADGSGKPPSSFQPSGILP